MCCASRWSRYHSVWSAQWATDDYCPFLWRVSTLSLRPVIVGTGSRYEVLRKAKTVFSEYELMHFTYSQAFWGQMIAAARAGPHPIHHKSLNENNLAEAIQYCLTPEAVHAAAKISQKM